MIFEQFSLTVFGILFLAGLVSLAFQRSYFTTSVMFSGIWSLVVLGKYHQNRFLGYDPVTSYSYELLMQGVGGMALGCLVAQVLLGRPRFAADRIAMHYAAVPSFVHRIFPFIFWTTFLSGMVAFFTSGGGLSFSFADLGDIRNDFIQGEGSNVFIDLARYATNLAFAGAIILALSDFVRGKFSLILLTLLCIAVLPLSLSKASRIEFVQVVLHYLSAALLLLAFRPRSRIRQRLNKAFLRQQARRGSILIASIIGLFSAIGLARSAGKSVYADVHGVLDSLLFPITGYVSSSIYAVGPLSEWIEGVVGPSYGSRYFEFFYKLLEQLGLEYANTKSVVRSAYDEIGSIAYNPGSFVRYLVSDFGSSALPYAAFAIGAFSTLVVLRANMLRLITFSFSTLVVFELIYSFQTIGLFSVSTAYKLVVIAFMSSALARHCRRTDHGARSFTVAKNFGKTS